jgi:ATPase subunit of ABC transporter with duplicated ATPase domains
VRELSSGEKMRLALARLLLGEHNLLALDEPTNHLDIETQDTLLDALTTFPGSILLISHDRHFVETLATETLDMRGEGAQT